MLYEYIPVNSGASVYSSHCWDRVMCPNETYYKGVSFQSAFYGGSTACMHVYVHVHVHVYILGVCDYQKM